MNRKQQAAYNRVYKEEVNQAIIKDGGEFGKPFYSYFKSMADYPDYLTNSAAFRAKHFDTLIASKKKAASRGYTPKDGSINLVATKEEKLLGIIIQAVNDSAKGDRELSRIFRQYTGSDGKCLRTALEQGHTAIINYINTKGEKKLRGRYITEPYSYKSGVILAMVKVGIPSKVANFILVAGVMASIYIIEGEWHGDEWEGETLKARIGVVGHHSENRRSPLRRWDYELRAEQDDYYLTHNKEGKYIPPDKRW